MVNWKEVAEAVELNPQMCAKELATSVHQKGVIGVFVYYLESEHRSNQTTTPVAP